MQRRTTTNQSSSSKDDQQVNPKRSEKTLSTSLYAPLKHYKRTSWIVFTICILISVYLRVLSTDAIQVFPTLKRRVLFLVVGTILQLVMQGLAFLTFNSYFESELNSQSEISSYSKAMAIVFLYLSVTFNLQYLSHMYGYLQDSWFIVLVSQPAACFTIVSTLHFVFIWPVTKLLGLVRLLNKQQLYTVKKVLFHIALIISLVGLHHTVYPSDPEEIYASVYNDPSLLSLKHPTLPSNESTKIKIIQMSDIHLGTQMSVKQLESISNDLINKYNREMELEPNSNIFVLLTGDFYTLGSHMETEALRIGLGPLKQLKGKVFACLGNHDHEVIESVVKQLESLGVTVLIDQTVSIPLNNGKFVDIVGLDFKHSLQNPKLHIETLMNEQYQKLQDPNYIEQHIARLVLLHNPAYFQYMPHDIPNNIPTLVFSGHLHSGQFGIRSFFGNNLRDKYPETVVSIATGWPDHGWWCWNSENKVARALYAHEKGHCKKEMLLYAHSGSGFYGLPLRVGTESELPWIMSIHIIGN
jgi:predicted MPP superfamily phosphohydrolase